MPSAQTSLVKGQVLGRYELLAPVARGGMGQVWVARLRGARGFQKLVAIKTVLAAPGDAGRLEQMLLEEARLAALIQHTNVAQTLELGEHEGTLYLVMEWIDGEPLSYLFSCAEPHGGMPITIAVNLVAQMLRGLHAAHELVDENGKLRGVVHRDVSPHNVLVTYTGVAKLVDFGIAKAINEQLSSTATGEIKGKFSYMAPEQILGDPIDRRADIFSAGIVLYTLTTGCHPFKNHHPAGALHSITSEEPAPRPSLIKPGYSRTLEAVVTKALEKTSDARWSSAEEMRIALKRALPHAFAEGMDTQVRAYLAQLVGKRAELKREALHKAVQSAGSESSLQAIPQGAQSAGSLRAVSISGSDEPSARISQMATPEPPRDPLSSGGAAAAPRRRRRFVGVGLAVTAALGLALVGLRRQDSASTAAAPFADASSLASASAPRAHADAGASTTSSRPTQAPEARASAASIGATSLPSASATSGHSQRPPARAAGASVKHNAVKAAKDLDLIAPDYAR